MDLYTLLSIGTGLVCLLIATLYALSGWRARQLEATYREKAEWEEKKAQRERAYKARVKAEKGGTTGGDTGTGTTDMDLDLPEWLVGVVQGVGLDPEALAQGDAGEWQKALKVADQVVPEKWKAKGKAQATAESEGVMVLG